MRKLALIPAIIVAAAACGMTGAGMVGAGSALAQATATPPPPAMTNVIPDGGSYAVTGRIQAINAAERTLSIAPSSGSPVSVTVPAGISLDGLSNGDHVSAHYSRTVTFVVGTPDATTARATESVGQAARTPGGIDSKAHVIVARVVNVDGPGRFDIVNVNGGGVYTVRATDPARVAALSGVRTGDSVTVSIGPVLLTSLARCGWFGMGC